MATGVGCAVAAVASSGCSNVNQDLPVEVVVARFDPEQKVVPMPTDILRDEAAGRLDLPADDEDLTGAEREFFTYLNKLDGWPTTMQAKVEFSKPVSANSVTTDTLQVWKWGDAPALVDDARVELSADQREIAIDAPREGWDHGATYVVMARGGPAGIAGLAGEPVVCDAAYYFLRLREQLDTPQHEHAFPGDTAEERRDNARQLEEIRVELQPYFEFFEARDVPREDVAALWTFTTTRRAELAMDKASQRMPLPIDLLIDHDTGRIDIPIAEWDGEVEAEAKTRLRAFDGFGVSANLLFGFTAPMDPSSFGPDAVALYRVDGGQPVRVPAAVTLMDDRMHAYLTPDDLPLAEGTTYAIVVSDAARDAGGAPAVAMPVGHLLRSRAPVAIDGASEIDAVADDDAAKVEVVRAQVVPVLDALGRDDVLAAWTFTTMTIEARLADAVSQAAQRGTSSQPANITSQTPFEAMAEFILGFASLFNVSTVYRGTIETPVFLDPVTRAWREDGGYEVHDVKFAMTIPNTVQPGQPLKVVVFNHAIVTDRNFVLALGDALAAQGFAAIAIDLPLHGDRTFCIGTGPLSTVDPETGEITEVEPCEAGTTCSEDGRCVDANGSGNHLARWPFVGMPVASGAAFIEVEHIANTADHFRQALVDVGALMRSLREGDWNAAIGHPIDTDNIVVAGMSLGSIISATYLPFDPGIRRAVLNVPGSDSVDLFATSPFFKAHVEGFFTRQGIEEGSFEHERFLDVARWIIDSVDPQAVAYRLLENRDVMLQMATQDTIIPNASTLNLERLSGAERIDYDSDHIFLVLPFDANFGPGQADLAEYLAR